MRRKPVKRDATDEDPGRDWMLRLQAGERDAFDAIVLHYQRAVRQFVGRYLSDAARAEDISQEAFLRVYKARKRYEPTAKFSTWLFTIVTRLCLNEIRRYSRQPKMYPAHTAGANGDDNGDDLLAQVADEAVETPAETLERVELQELMREAIDGLPEKQRAAILLLRYRECSYQEIADALGVTTMAVKSLVNRARETLRRRLESYRGGKRAIRGSRSSTPTAERSKTKPAASSQASSASSASGGKKRLMPPWMLTEVNFRGAVEPR